MPGNVPVSDTPMLRLAIICTDLSLAQSLMTYVSDGPHADRFEQTVYTDPEVLLETARAGFAPHLVIAEVKKLRGGVLLG